MTTTMTTNPYHVVKCSHNGEFRTYEIYKNNERVLVPYEGHRLKKQEAYSIVKMFNTAVAEGRLND